MTANASEIVELHAALTRARAMGFERTAEAMQRVFDEMLANSEPNKARSRPHALLEEKT